MAFVPRRQRDDVDGLEKVAARGHDDGDVRRARVGQKLLPVLVGEGRRAEEELGAVSHLRGGLDEEVAALLPVEAPEQAEPHEPVARPRARGLPGTSTPLGITVIRSRGMPTSTIESATCCATAAVRALRSTMR